MDSILDAVIRIEKEAQALAGNVENMPAEPDSPEDDLRKIEEEAMQKADRRIENIRAEQDRRQTEQTAAIEKDLATRLEEIDASYEQHKAEWADALYDLAVREYRE